MDYTTNQLWIFRALKFDTSTPIMDFTSEDNVEDLNQTNTSEKQFYVAGKALAELVGNQVYLTPHNSSFISEYFHDGFFPADAESRPAKFSKSIRGRLDIMNLPKKCPPPWLGGEENF